MTMIQDEELDEERTKNPQSVVQARSSGTGVVQQEYSFAEAAHSLGVSAAMIGRWKRRLGEDRSVAFPGEGKRTA